MELDMQSILTIIFILFVFMIIYRIIRQRTAVEYANKYSTYTDDGEKNNQTMLGDVLKL